MDVDATGWPTSFEEARAVQENLRARVVTTDDFGAVRTVAGVDTGYEGDVALGGTDPNSLQLTTCFNTICKQTAIRFTPRAAR